MPAERIEQVRRGEVVLRTFQAALVIQLRVDVVGESDDIDPLTAELGTQRVKVGVIPPVPLQCRGFEGVGIRTENESAYGREVAA